MNKKYTHDYSIIFSIDSDHPTGEDLTIATLYKALHKRITDLDGDPDNWKEAIGLPIKTIDNNVQTKSTIIKEMANNLNIPVIDIKLSNVDPNDLYGIPKLKE